MNKKAFGKYSIIGLFVICAFWTHSVSAQVFTPLDNWPDQWSSVFPASSNPLIGMTTVTVGEQEREYFQISRTSDNVGSGIAFWNGNDQIENGLLGNIAGSVIVHRTTGTGVSAHGVLLGAVTKTYTSNVGTNHRGYYIGLVPNASGNAGPHMGIWYNVLTNEENPLASALTYTSVEGYVINTDYLLEFYVHDREIVAELWSIDANDEKVALLGTVSYTAESTIEGYFGLYGGRYGNSTRGYFRDLNIAAIPEPSMIGAFATAIFGLAILRRRCIRAAR